MNQMKDDNFDEMMVKKEIALNKIVENGMVELNEKMKRGMNELKDEIKKGLADLKAMKKSKLEEENRELKKKIEKMAVYMKELKSSIRRRALPNELINHLFSSLPFENAFDLLAKMPNGLLAKIVEKMINGMKEGLRKNKWNKDDCGSKLVISQGGLAVRHKGPAGWHCVRAILPIPSFSLKDIDKTIISSYFEVQIIHKSSRYASIEIGFFDKQFNLESEYQGRGEANSISLCHKEELSIEGAIKLTKLKKGNGCIYFEKGDFIGIGIIHKANSLMECFATWNGNFLGKHELPAIYANIQLFPAISMSNRGDSMGANSDDDAIRVNFGKNPWRFQDFRYIH